MDFPKTKQCLWDTTSAGPATYLHLNYYRKPKICIPEKILRLVQHQCEHYSQWNHKLIASLVVEDDGEGVQFQVDRLDTLQAHQTDASCLVPGDLIIPFEVSNNKAKDRQGSAECYADAFNKLHQRCSSKASIELSSFMELYGWASFYSNNHTSVVHIDFDMITLETVIKATPINPIPIVLTALSKNLAGPMSLSHMQGLPKTGYLTMDHTRKLLLVLESDPKTSNLPVVGIWVSGVELVQHPFVWAACLRYIHNVHLQDRVCKATEEFLIVLYTPLHSRPEFYQGNTATDKLNFQLCSGHEVTNMVKSLSSPSDNITELELGLVHDGDKMVYFDAAKAKHLLFLANKAGHFSSLAEDLQPRSAPAPHTENIPAIVPMVPDVSILWNEASPHYEPTSGMAPKQAQSHMMSPAVNTCQSNVMWNSPGPPDKQFKSPFYTQPKDLYLTQQNSATGLKYSPHQEITSVVGRKSLTLTSVEQAQLHSPRSETLTFPQHSIPKPQVMNTALRQEVLRSGGPKSQASTSAVGHQSPRYPGSPLSQHYPHNAAAAHSSTASNSVSTTTAVQSYVLHPTTPLAQHYMQNASASIPQNLGFSATSPSTLNFIHNTNAPFIQNYAPSTSAPSYVQSPSAPFTQNYVHNSSAPSYVQSPSATFTQNYVHSCSAPSYVQSPSAPFTQSYAPYPVTSLAQHYVHNASPHSPGTYFNQNYVHTPSTPSNQNYVQSTPTNQDQNCAYNGPQYSLVPFSGQQQTPLNTSNGSSNTQQPPYAEPRHNNAQFLKTIMEETFSSLEPQAKEDRSENKNHSSQSGEIDDDDSGLSVTPDKVNPAKQTVPSLGQDNARRDQLPVSESLKWDQVPADIRALLVQQQEQIKQLQQQIQLLMQEKSKAADPSPVLTQIPPSSAKQSPTQEILSQRLDSIEPTRPKDTAHNQVVHQIPVEPSMNCTSVDEQTSPQTSVIWAGEVSNSGVHGEQMMNTGLSELEVDIPGYVSTQDRSQFNESPSSVSDYYRNSKDDSYSTVAEDASDPKQFYHQIMSTINRMLHNSNSQSNETTNGLNESEMALQASGLNGGGSLNTTSPHINYVSMLLGCHSDNGQSMEINAMAMKYLNDDQLTEIAKLCQSGGGKTHQIQYAAKMFQRVISSCDQSTVSPNDMTIGTRQYLEKHGLLGNETSIIAPTLSNQSSVQLKTEFSMITDVSNGNWGSPNAKYSNNPVLKDTYSKQKENISPSVTGDRNEKWLPGRGIPRDLGASPVLHAPKEYNARLALDESFTHMRLNQNEQFKNEAVQKKNSSESLQQKDDKILDIEKLKQMPKLL